MLLGEPEPTPLVIRALRRIGLVRVLADGSVRWPIHIAPKHMWSHYAKHQPWFGVFRNLPGVVKWEKGRLLPRRWGFRFIIIEIGDRG
jgi:hypothetical protein